MRRGIDFLRVQDVSSAPAQSTTVCNVCDMSLISEYSSDVSFMNICGYSVKIGIIYLIQKRFALRISETLSITYKNITSKGSVVVKGLKGSNDKLVYLPELCNWFIECRVNKVDPFYGLSRFAVYRIYKKFNVNYEENYGNKIAVTHGFRYKKVREIKEIENDLSLSSIVLGHKNINSTHYYDK